MSDKDTGGPAFPGRMNIGYDGSFNEGMTLRDYFAAKAMQAFIVKGVTPAEGLNLKQAIVSMAYETAEEMLKAREQK